MSTTTTTILLVDDSEGFRRATRALLEAESDLAIVGEAADGETALTLEIELAPTVVLMDIGLPGENGIETTQQLMKSHADCCVVVLSLRDDRAAIDQAKSVGAAGYVSKLNATEDLSAAIRTVAAGGTSFNASPRECQN